MISDCTYIMINEYHSEIKGKIRRRKEQTSKRPADNMPGATQQLYAQGVNTRRDYEVERRQS